MILAGSGSVGYTNGPGPNARFKNPYGIVFNPKGNTNMRTMPLMIQLDGNCYVADSTNCVIRKVSAQGKRHSQAFCL